MPRFRNPPIVEAWLAFDFSPKPDKVAWEKDAKQFRQASMEEFPHAQFVFTSELEVEDREDGSVPVVKNHEKKVNLIRMRSEDGMRVLQLADDRMAFNLLKAGKDYPGFEALLSEAQRHLKTYIEIYQPSGIRHATIHYADVISIPVGDEPIECEDYFRLLPNIPEQPFGMTGGISLQFVTHAPHDQQLLQISISRIPSGTAADVRFRLDWEKRADTGGTLDAAAIEAVLWADHNFLIDCFMKSLTPRTLDLFDQIPEE